MKIKNLKKLFTVLMAILILGSNSITVFAEGETAKPNTTTTINGVSSSEHDLVIEAKQSTIMGDTSNRYIEVNVRKVNGRGYIKNAVAYATIENPNNVQIADSGTYQLYNINNGDYFRIPLYTFDTGQDVTVPIKITIKYDIEKGITSTTTITDKDNKKNNSQTIVTDNTFISKEITTTIYVVHKAAPSNAIVEVSKVDVLPNGVVTPGDNFELAFRISNPGNAVARNIKLSLEGLDAKGINMEKGLSTQDITELGPKSDKTIVYSMKIPASAKGGLYPLTLKYSFTKATPKGAETTAPIEGSYTFSVDVKQANMDPSAIIFETIEFPQGRLGKNQKVNVSFTLKNIGKNKAQNIKIAAISKEVDGLVPISGSNVVVPELKPNQSAKYSFDFKTTNSVSTKAYPVEITVSYIDDASQEEPHTVTQIVSVNGVDWEAEALKNKDLPTTTPILIIEKYEFNPNIIFAGVPFDMSLKIRNTSDTKAIKNIKVSLSSENVESTDKTVTSTASVFTPIQSSNTFHIDSIPPGGVIDKTISFTTPHDTVAKTYTVTANMEYEDAKATQYKSSEIIGVTVVQDSKFSIGEIKLEPNYTVGTPGNLSVDFYNTGKVNLSNFMVNFEAENIASDMPTYYKGNFPSGTSDTYSCSITPETAEAKKGKLIFTYEDTTGKEHRIEKEFTIQVNDAPEFPEGEGNFPTETPKQSKLPFIIGGGLLAAAAVVGGLIYKKRRAKKQEEDLTIDED